MFVLFLSGSWTREGGFLNNLNTWGLESNWSINKPDLLFLNKFCQIIITSNMSLGEDGESYVKCVYMVSCCY